MTQGKNKVFRMEILFDPKTNRVGLKGPLEDTDLCLLGLEMARREILKMAKNKIIVPTTMRMPALPPMPSVPDLKKMLENGS